METFATRRYYRTFLFAFTFGIVLIGAALAAGWVFLLLPTSLGEGYGAVLNTVKETQRILLGKVAFIYLVMTVFMLGAVMLLHLFYSHRIAGPTYRLGREASAIGKGDLKGNIRFRRKDNLTDMAESLNQVSIRYRGRVGAMKDYLSLIENQADAMAQLIQKGEQPPALERGTEEIIKDLKNIEQVLSEVRT